MDIPGWQDKAEGLEAELHEALGLLGRVGRGERDAKSVAWWLAANFRKYVVDDCAIEVAAEAHGDAPRGTWDEWWEAAREDRKTTR